MFRRIYWVTEYVHEDGRSEVHGVYTSIPNLVRQGLDRPAGTRLRLTLTKLDCEEAPLGTWLEPNFEGLSARLDEFVRTDEFSRDQCQALMDALVHEAKAA
jgi:hypothetical protein